MLGHEQKTIREREYIFEAKKKKKRSERRIAKKKSLNV